MQCLAPSSIPSKLLCGMSCFTRLWTCAEIDAKTYGEERYNGQASGGDIAIIGMRVPSSMCPGTFPKIAASKAPMSSLPEPVTGSGATPACRLVAKNAHEEVSM